MTFFTTIYQCVQRCVAAVKRGSKKTVRFFRWVVVRSGHKKRIRRSEPPYPICYNCGQELRGMYCHSCGQHARDITPSLGVFIWQYCENAFQWDGKFIRTVRTLFAHPGKLDVAFVRGRVARYVFPLKLYMLIMVLFGFVAIATIDSVSKVKSDPKQMLSDSVMVEKIRTAAVLDSTQMARMEDCVTLSQTTWQPKQRIILNSLDNLMGRLPFIFMFAVPFFALLAKGIYRHRYPTYIPHLVYAIHLHTVLFIVVILGLFVSCFYSSDWLMVFGFVWLFWYNIVASMRFYGCSWWGAPLKTAGIFSLYLFVCLIIFVIGVLANLAYDAMVQGVDISSAFS